MDLHYSQTIIVIRGGGESFTTLWIYTILKPLVINRGLVDGFTTLWIYTILKHEV